MNIYLFIVIYEYLSIHSYLWIFMYSQLFMNIYLFTVIYEYLSIHSSLWIYIYSQLFMNVYLLPLFLEEERRIRLDQRRIFQHTAWKSTKDIYIDIYNSFSCFYNVWVIFILVIVIYEVLPDEAPC